ncbi:MAG: helix-turn-helix domain-containing protein [Silvanigrellales bacterium]|nr:helix-turn-helix domain-containing protein [Silvanigrellales bacterium]
MALDEETNHTPQDDVHTVDVTEASQALGVSLARLSQLTSKGTLSHVRRRVGARWRIFYRRDEIDDMARVQRAVVYTRPPSYVPLPLPPTGDRNKSAKEAERLGARGRPDDPFLTPFESPFAESVPVERPLEPFSVPPAIPPRKTGAHFGYGGDLSRAETLRQSEISADGLSRIEAAVESLFPRIEGLETSLSEVAVVLRALRLDVPAAGHANPRSAWFSRAVQTPSAVPEDLVMPVAPEQKQPQRRAKARTTARVRFDSGRRF